MTLYTGLMGDTYQEAYESLLSICKDSILYGGSRGVCGGANCICFTETPKETFHENVVGQFKPFGIEVEKAWLFEQGGRPVIYQPRDELQYLAPSIHWRHVDFSIGHSEQYRNYTWQREWRIQKDELHLPSNPAVIVPNEEWANKLQEDIISENMWRGCEENMDLGYYYTYRPVLQGEFMIFWLGMS